MMSGDIIEVNLGEDYYSWNLRLYLSRILASTRFISPTRLVISRRENGEYTQMESSDPVLPGETYYAVVVQEPEYFLRYANNELQVFEEDRKVLSKTKHSGLFTKNSTLSEHGVLHVELCEEGWELLWKILQNNNLHPVNKEADGLAFCSYFLDRSYTIKLAD